MLEKKCVVVQSYGSIEAPGNIKNSGPGCVLGPVGLKVSGSAKPVDLDNEIMRVRTLCVLTILISESFARSLIWR